MLVSLNWLNERLDLTAKSISELGDLLTFAGIEVEGVQSQGPATDAVVVAEIQSAAPHPDADRLKVCKVDVGDQTPRQIVCGAQNYQVGDRVPCALPGAELPGGLSIKVGKLRGVESAGMLCGPEEIGYPAGEDGLMILPPDAPLGKPVREVLASDTIFQVEITPNRPDLLSHSGMARELAALLQQSGHATAQWCPVAIPDPPSKPTDAPKVAATDKSTDKVPIEIQAAQACPFYSALRITNVSVKDSPTWLKEKLNAIGLRPINNVVDVTNYVLHELGQPLHAFDASKVQLPLVIRMAHPGEQFLALDETTYDLDALDVVISDAQDSVLALGGVMGGQESGTTEATTEILLESALFHTSTIRRTSRRTGLSSDSSYRFERGVDPMGAEPAARLAAHWICELTGGTIVDGMATCGTPGEPPAPIAFDQPALERVAGSAIPWKRACEILESLGIREAAANLWTVPTWRVDLERGIDLAEEVVRVFGLDNIPAVHTTTLVEPSLQDQAYDAEMQLKQRLAALGFFEAQTVKLISPSQREDCLPIHPLEEGDIIGVARPLSEEHAWLRPSMLPGLLATASLNARQLAKSLRFFETGTVFRNRAGGKARDIESQSLGILLSGLPSPVRWDNPGKNRCDLFDLKAVIQSLTPRMPIAFTTTRREGFLLACDITLGKKKIGVAAMVSPGRAQLLDIDSPIFAAELDLKKVIAAMQDQSAVRELPQFPGSSRDLAIQAPLELTHHQIQQTIDKVNEPLLVHYVCFDVFTDPEGKSMASDRKSMAFSFTYRSPDETLTNDQVSAAHEKIRNAIRDALPVSFR